MVAWPEDVEMGILDARSEAEKFTALRVIYDSERTTQCSQWFPVIQKSLYETMKSERRDMSELKRANLHGTNRGKWQQLQSWVTAGVSMNLGSAAMMTAYTAGMLPQLVAPDSEIPMDESIGSWIAATPGMSAIIGNMMMPVFMSRYGRRMSNLLSIILMLLGWLCIYLAKNVATLILGRFTQGISCGSMLNIGPVLIAEYTSPNNRGAFLMTISLLCSINVFIGHVFGTNFKWTTAALVGVIITVLNLPIALLSPESPTWLIEKGRYDEGKRAFRWLRGSGEEDELEAMIAASIKTENSKKPTWIKFSVFKDTLRKKEFYMPIFLMIHIYGICQWAGINCLTTYSIDVLSNIIGKENNLSMHIAILDCQRMVSNLGAVYIIKKMRRRTMLFSTTILNIMAFLAQAAYVYARANSYLPFDYPTLGVTLVHIHMFTLACGTLPMPFIIAGEIFPLEYKGIGGGICAVSYALYFFLTVKTLPFLFRTIGMHGAYCLYAGICTYCLLIAWKFLPETKDRTLQDIENDLRGKPLGVDELKTVESLIS